MATHSSILAWRIPWTEELGGPQSMSCKESDTTEQLNFAKKSCLTLCDSMDCSPLGPFVEGILQARILEWVAISFSRKSFRTKE